MLCACQKYAVSLNDKTIYTPPGVFKDFTIADTALANCVTQTLYDLHATSAEQLTQLDCSNAGITDLTGLSKFYALTRLNLASNKIENLEEIGKLGRLEILILDHNAIKNAAPLLHLLHLKQLNIGANTEIRCAELHQLSQALPQQLQLTAPTHCAG